MAVSDRFSKKKTNPNHKMMGVRIIMQATCSCGWRSGSVMGKGARSGAIQEWHIHREACEEQERRASPSQA